MCFAAGVRPLELKTEIMQITYDLIQRIVVTDGVPKIMSSTIQVVNGVDLLSIAQNWIQENTDLLRFNKQQYIGYKRKGDKRYFLVVTPRANFLQITFCKETVSNPESLAEFEFQTDPLFPYAVKTVIESEEQLAKLLGIVIK